MNNQDQLNRLYTKQRRLNAAKQGATDSRLKQTLEKRQQMMERRIGQLQAKQKIEQRDWLIFNWC